MSEPAPGNNGHPNNEAIQVLDLYQTAEKIYTRRLNGFFRRLQNWSWMPFLGAYFLIPWLQIDGRPAMLFDLVERKFHVFWITFWPQDFPLLAWLLIIAAFALFTVTNLFGRVWCGFSCPQTVFTQIFMAIEERFEGDRNRRIRLDNSPWGAQKIARKGGKLIAWLVVAFATGLTFVGYFNPIGALSADLVSWSAHPAAVFWVAFFTLGTFVNAGFMREQICKYVCPYARFQSVMFDSDTLVVSYNAARGEQRGSRRHDHQRGSDGLGDCVDCTLCVQVCPTGIDIRDGLQYECISCGLCIDACNAVMDKLHYPRGLISFTSENALLKGEPVRFLRPRFVGYVSAVTVMTLLFVYTLATRIPLEVDVLRDRDMLYRLRPDGAVENSYTVKINNMDQRDHHYTIAVEGGPMLAYTGQREVMIEAGEVGELLIRLTSSEPLSAANIPISFVVSERDQPTLSDRAESRFISPAPRR